MDNGHLVRYVAPTKFDNAPYGQVWDHITDDGIVTFIQTSKDEESPQWMRMGYFLELVYKHEFYNEQWINQCLHRLVK